MMSYICQRHIGNFLTKFTKVIKSRKICFRFYSIPKAKQLGSEIALYHFDQFYNSVYPNWASIRLGLLCPHSYCAVANVFAQNKTVDDLFGDLKVFNMKDAYHVKLGDLDGTGDIPEICKEDSSQDNSQRTSSFFVDKSFSRSSNDMIEKPDLNAVVEIESEFMPATELKHREFDSNEFLDFYTPDVNFEAEVIKHGVIHYPENWEMYYPPRGKFKRFLPPKTDVSGLLNYYLMDGASLLPVLALDIQKGEDVGDLCASPGGKTLAILFGMQFKQLVCNDASLKRVNKLKTVLNSYIPGTQEWSKKILVSNLDVTQWNLFDAFDKILLDVPCTNDRMSVTKDINNIFSQSRFHERMQIPRTQTNMLCSALKSLKPGGSLVYSTCSLSPIQNDGVIHMALSRLSTELTSEFVVQDLTEAFLPLRKMFQFSDTCSYGQLVVPFLPLNYGPMYISKITRTKN